MKFIEALDYCNADLLPIISTLLSILATLPVTTCSVESSFSSLRYLKNYLRNTTGETRLNGLASMYIHGDIEVNVDEVLDRLANGKRRLQF